MSINSRLHPLWASAILRLARKGKHVRKVRTMFDTMNPDSPYFLDYVEELTAWYPEEEEDYEDYEDYED